MFLLLLFSCISFKKLSLLTSVSEFNCRCFLRSQCSMEMWSPDEVGRVGWVGLGHVLGREHDSTLQSGVHAPRLLKRSLCVVVCVVCVL